MNKEFSPIFSPWRHGGWYVDNVSYPEGGVGCVSRNYPDRKWRVVCAEGADADLTYGSRDAAARAERLITLRQWDTVRPSCAICGERIYPTDPHHTIHDTDGTHSEHVACRDRIGGWDA